jgi:hypothetical protein
MCSYRHPLNEFTLYDTRGLGLSLVRTTGASSSVEDGLASSVRMGRCPASMALREGFVDSGPFLSQGNSDHTGKTANSGRTSQGPSPREVL